MNSTNSSVRNVNTKRYLDLAARVASRGFGLVEPNPMVGAVIVKDDQVIGIGHHTRYGELHAEREALKNARENGHDVAGSVVYCTLEPCCHHGKQPPCCDALIEAGVAEVIYARPDPAEISGGGHAILEQAGIQCTCDSRSINAVALSDPFVHRVRTGLPWVITKWAQTIDGKIATRTGESQWISNSQSRNRVHRLRAKVDAILIGSGTAIADDPMLTARSSAHTRRQANRVVLDSKGGLPHSLKLIQSAGDIPTIVFTSHPEHYQGTQCIVVATPLESGHIDIRWALKKLAKDFQCSTVLVEAGPRVLGALIEEDMIDEAVVHIAPAVMGDEHAKAVAQGVQLEQLHNMNRFNLVWAKPNDHDLEVRYRRVVD